MKRFTDTEKWSDQWYRKLTPRLKCLWQYICDTCDPSGVFDVDWELAEFRIGEKVSKEDIKAFGDRVETLPNGKHLIRKFIPFQYGRISLGCRGHRSVINSINHNGLVECWDELNRVCKGYTYPKHRDECNDTHGVRQDRTGSVQKGSVQGSVQVNTVVNNSTNGESVMDDISIILRKEYRRSDTSPLDYFEQYTLAEIVRTHPDAKSELKELLDYRVRAEFFPKSIRGLLEAWNKTLDRAREPAKLKPGGPNGKTPDWIVAREIDALISEHPANRDSICYNRNCSQSDKDALKELKRKRSEIQQRIVSAG